jgi:hypothetical protein
MIEMKPPPNLVPCLVLAAAMLLAFSAKAAGVSVETASRAELNAAKDPYQEGVRAMSAGRYSAAVDKFRESYNIVASPNSQLMLGRALIKVNRLMEAYRELQEAVARATELAATQHKYQKTAESAKREIDDLKLELAFVTVIPGTEVILGGRKLSAADWGKPQPMMPGRARVEIVASDGRTREKNMRLDPGETRVLTADFSSTSSRLTRSKDDGTFRVEQSRDDSSSTWGGRRNLGYIAGGIGLAGVIGFAGLTLYASSTFGTPTDDCKGSTCSRAVVNNAGHKGLLNGIGYGLLGVGVAGLGLGTYLVLSDRGDSSATTTAIGVGPGSVALAGTF